MDKEITMRSKAFKTESIREYKMIVEDDGSVKVYDSVAGYYTRCHSLCEAAVRRARKIASKKTKFKRSVHYYMA